MNLHQTFAVPAPREAVDLVMRDGAAIRLRRYGQPGSTRIVLSHGNGLAINAYLPFWLPLADTYDVVLFDIRNHGENPLHDPDTHGWEIIYDDYEEIFHGISRHFGEARTIGAFHSLSSIAALEHTLRQGRQGDGKRWDALCLFDPPILPREGHPLYADQLVNMEEHSARALRRQATFDSPEQLASQFRRRSSFGRWVPEAAGLLARHTLRPTEDGRWTLCCPPELEARIFRSNVDPTQYTRMKDVTVPFMLMAGDPASPHASPAAFTAKAAHEEMGIDYAMVPDTTHFLQLEEPQACRDLLIDFMQRHGLD